MPSAQSALSGKGPQARKGPQGGAGTPFKGRDDAWGALPLNPSRYRRPHWGLLPPGLSRAERGTWAGAASVARLRHAQAA